MSKPATKKARQPKDGIIRLDEAYENAADMVPRIVTGLLMAHPGVGKSTYLSSVTSHVHPNDCLFLEIEEGAYTAPATKDVCVNWLERNGCFPHPVERTVPCRDHNEVLAMLTKYVLKPSGQNGGVSPVRFVGIDSATEIARCLVMEKKPHKAGKDSRAKWFEIYAWWLDLWALFKQTSEVCFFFTSHLRDMESKSMLQGKKPDEMGEQGRETETMILPSVDGQARDMLMQRCHNALYLARNGHGANANYKVWTDQTGDIPAKSRGNIEYTENRTLGALLEASGYLEYYEPTGKLREEKR